MTRPLFCLIALMTWGVFLGCGVSPDILPPPPPPGGDKDTVVAPEEEGGEEGGEDTKEQDIEDSENPDTKLSDTDDPPPTDGSNGDAGDSTTDKDIESEDCQTDADCWTENTTGTCLGFVCEKDTGECVPGPVPDGNECDDLDPCTGPDYCLDGTCEGDPLNCDDDDPCTDDACGGNGCVHYKNSNICDDGDPCTGPDYCDDGICSGNPNPACGCETDADCAIFEDENLCNGFLVCNGDTCSVDPETIVVCEETAAQCTTAQCNPSSGACNEVPVNDGTSCDDIDPCTENDQCVLGECSGSDLPDCSCSSGNDCLALEDGDLCNGTLVCNISNNNCEVDPNTIVVCEDSTNACADATCIALIGACSDIAKPGNPGCDDGDPCTLDDACENTACVGGIEDTCDDDNGCTADSCETGQGCVNLPQSGDCDDEDACTLTDECIDGSCVGSGAPDCDDGEICTDNSCDPDSGCTTAANSNPCDDEDACTEDDECLSTICVGGIATNCNDGTPCTSDSCNSSIGCEYAPSPGSLCNDGDVCTNGDLCDGESNCLSGIPISCNDGDACTDDTCDATEGCIFAYNTGPCDDGNLCTGDGDCVQGICTLGEAILCDDGNACTNDECNENDGCITLPNTFSCDDGNACTDGDSCNNGECNPGPALECDDLNSCTADICSAADGCVNTPIENASCDDGDTCTSGETCDANGDCGGGVLEFCEDGNDCTSDECASGIGCLFAPSSGTCDDGNPCTQGEACDFGQCKGGVNSCECQQNSDCPIDLDLCNGVIICDTNGFFGAVNTCQDDPSQMVFCDSGNDTACMQNTCNPGTGVCSMTVQETATCDDGDLCTAGDHCVGSFCEGDTLVCDDGNGCTEDDCAAQSGCVFTNVPVPCNDGNECTGEDGCVDGSCTGTQIECTDENPCTAEACLATSGCLYPPLVGASCDDGDSCTGLGTCDTLGECGGGTQTACDDGLVCTNDVCDPSEGCTYLFNSEPCTDGNACTSNDTCADGGCFGTGLICEDDGNICTLQTCSPEEGCYDIFLEGEFCDDGKPCTEADTCNNEGICEGGNDVICNDFDGCTYDACTPGIGCETSPATDIIGCPAYDGDLDTIPDIDDNCPTVANTDQLDSNNDDIGDACTFVEGSCLNDDDVAVLKADPNVLSVVYDCFPGCDPFCTSVCTHEETGVSQECAGCYVTYALCALDLCQVPCQSANSDECGSCKDILCEPPLLECTEIGQPEPIEGCPDGSMAYCDGNCWPTTWWDDAGGDGTCDEALDCALFNDDEGDCFEGCQSGENEICDGSCMLIVEISAETNNGTCNPALQCLAFSNDGGDCEDLFCSAPETSGCLGECFDIALLGDDLGNGICDDYLNCNKFSSDASDCDQPETCPIGYVDSCVGACINTDEILNAYDDETCDAILACSTWLYDGGDCEGSCLDENDLQILWDTGTEELKEIAVDCIADCESAGGCGAECIQEETSNSMGCALCVGNFIYCILGNCKDPCQNGTEEECLTCVLDQCEYSLGIEEENPDDAGFSFMNCAGFEFFSLP